MIEIAMNATPAQDPRLQVPSAAAQPPRLLDEVARCAREHGASVPTIKTIVSWARAFILFHGTRHPRELGRAAVLRFLEYVVRTEKEPLPGPVTEEPPSNPKESVLDCTPTMGQRAARLLRPDDRVQTN